MFTAKSSPTTHKLDLPHSQDIPHDMKDRQRVREGKAGEDV